MLLHITALLVVEHSSSPASSAAASHPHPAVWSCAALSVQARLVHAEPRGVQLPQRHLYLMERLEDKVAAINARITGWRKALAAALAAAAPAHGAAAGADAAAEAAEGLEIAPVGVPVQVGLRITCAYQLVRTYCCKQPGKHAAFWMGRSVQFCNPSEPCCHR